MPSLPEVLIVEDNSDDLFFLQRHLQRAGLENPVFVAADGRVALNYFTERVATPGRLPCLVLLDLKLPLISGLELLEWMRGAPATARLPVVVLSSSAEERDTQRARMLGANAYCLKLPPVEALARLVEAMGQPDWPVGIARARLPSLLA